MIGLLQRVRDARVEVEGEVIGAIKHGLLVLVGVEEGDTDAQARRLAGRLLNWSRKIQTPFSFFRKTGSFWI